MIEGKKDVAVLVCPVCKEKNSLTPYMEGSLVRLYVKHVAILELSF